MFGRKSRRRLLRENAAMRQALLWYAAEETWRRKGIHQKGAPRKKWKKSPAAFDRGSVANHVLTEIHNQNERGAAWTISVPAPLERVAEEAKPGTVMDLPAPGPSTSTDTE